MRDMRTLAFASEVTLADKHEILDRSFLRPIGEVLTKLDLGQDVEGYEELKKWYKDYKIMYSYSDSYNENKTKIHEAIKEDISKNKDKGDLMNLVEISIGRLLEYYFSENAPNARVKKTTIGDDYFGSIDYIVEFRGEDGKINSAVGIDLTVFESEDEHELEARLFEKKRKKVTSPKDYISYVNKTGKGNIKKVPRLVLHMNKDLAYHFTNNFFEEVVSTGKLLTDDQIKTNLDYAIDDFNDFINSSGINKNIDISEEVDHEIISLINESKSKINNILYKY